MRAPWNLIYNNYNEENRDPLQLGSLIFCAVEPARHGGLRADFKA